tara:strand:- start:6178 stop:7371 length:1194 start_codon:yes stop_codon:yes gene_type:complete
MFKYFIISILVFISPIFSEDSVKDDKQEEVTELVVEETEETTFFGLNTINPFSDENDIGDYNILKGAIPSYTTTSNPGKMKIGFGINSKEYNNYYHSDGNSFGIDYLDCGTDGQCPTIYQDIASDGNDILFTAPIESIVNPNWFGPDANGSEGDGINGFNAYTSNGITVSAMYHGMNGVGFDFYFLQEKRNYTFLTDIIDRGLVEHPWYDNALAFDPTQDWTHYDFGVYYVWNEIEGDYPLLNTNQYTSPITRILSGLYFKGSNSEESNLNAIYVLNAMDFMVHDKIIWSNQLVIDYQDNNNISPCSIKSKLIWNIMNNIALAPSFTYKKYDSIETADSDIYEGFVMLEGAFQFKSDFGNLDYNIQLMPYFMMSLLGSENLIHANNEFGLNLNLFFN